MFGNEDLCKGINGNKGVVHQLGCNLQLNLFCVVLGEETFLEHGNIDNSFSINYNMPRGLVYKGW